MDVEEVGDEDDRDQASSPPRSSPSPTSIATSPASNPPKKSGDTFSVSALLRPDPPSAHLQNASPHRDTASIGAHPPPPGSTMLYPPLHLQGGLLPPHPHHPLSYLHPQLLPHHLLPPHLHPLLRGVHPAHPGLHSTHTGHGLHHTHPLGDVYSCVKCDKMFSTPHGLEVSLRGICGSRVWNSLIGSDCGMVEVECEWFEYGKWGMMCCGEFWKVNIVGLSLESWCVYCILFVEGFNRNSRCTRGDPTTARDPSPASSATKPSATRSA